MSGSKSRDKGARLEREVINILKAAGVPAKRISMMETGGVDKGDVLAGELWEIEVKGGSHVPKFIYDACKKPEHWLVCKRDRKPWKIVMGLTEFLEKFI